MFEKCVLTILEFNWNQRLGHKKTKLNICHHMLTLSTQLQNRSFDVVERTRTSSKCQKMKNARAVCKNPVFHRQICKFVGFLLPSSSWLLKLPIINSTRATTQVPQALEIRALTHPLKNLRTFSDGTVRRKMILRDEFSREFEAELWYSAATRVS